jgi:hypothetical protein
MNTFQIILVLIGIGSIGFLAIRHIIKVRSKRNLEKFKLNYQRMLMREAQELMNTIKYLTEESLELTSKHGLTDEHDELKNQAALMQKLLDEAYENFMNEEDLDESVSTFTLFKVQLENMVIVIDNGINTMKENLGEERIIN